jgi:hypothetical protein
MDPLATGLKAIIAESMFPTYTILHCNEYPNTDMTRQDKMIYERTLVTVAGEEIQGRSCHMQEALEGIRIGMLAAFGPTVSVKLLDQNLTDVCPCSFHHLFSPSQILLQYRSNGLAVRGACQAVLSTPHPITGITLCLCRCSTFGGLICDCSHGYYDHRSIEESWDYLMASEFVAALKQIERDQFSKTLLVIGDSSFLPGTAFMRELEHRFLVKNKSIE